MTGWSRKVCYFSEARVEMREGGASVITLEASLKMQSARLRRGGSPKQANQGMYWLRV